MCLCVFVVSYLIEDPLLKAICLLSYSSSSSSSAAAFSETHTHINTPSVIMLTIVIVNNFFAEGNNMNSCLRECDLRSY